jgi:hypothetical protein
MIVEPFADVDENDPTYQLQEGDDANSPGDLVHRWSVHSLMSQVQHALEWPEAPFFPSASPAAYGDTSFLVDVGARVQRQQLGFGEHSMKAALAWEDEVGTCTKPNGDPDFIDQVTDDALGYTLEEAMLAVKEPGHRPGVVVGPQRPPQ